MRLLAIAVPLLMAAADNPPRISEVTLTAVSPSDLSWKTEAEDQHCRLDSNTHYDTLMRPFRAGDRVSMWIWEPAPGDCRLLSVRLIAGAAPVGERTRIRLNLNPLDSIFQRGDLQYSGVVLTVSGNRMTVQTRTAGRLIFLLRPDTHYLFGGSKVTIAEVPMNQRVYVRAGTTFEGHLEAFRVAWGNIVLLNETELGRGASAWGKP